MIHEPAVRSRERNTLRGQGWSKTLLEGSAQGPPPSCNPTVAQLCCSRTRAQSVHLAVPKSQVPRSCSAMAQAEAGPGNCCCLESKRQEPALPVAVGTGGKSPSNKEGT